MQGYHNTFVLKWQFVNVVLLLWKAVERPSVDVTQSMLLGGGMRVVKRAFSDK
jgi:hypothetical protein